MICCIQSKFTVNVIHDSCVCVCVCVFSSHKNVQKNTIQNVLLTVGTLNMSVSDKICQLLI